MRIAEIVWPFSVPGHSVTRAKSYKKPICSLPNGKTQKGVIPKHNHVHPNVYFKISKTGSISDDAKEKSITVKTGQQRAAAREAAAVRTMVFTELMEVYRYYTWFQINNLHFVYNNYDFRHQCSTIKEVATRLKIRDQLERLLHAKVVAAAKAQENMHEKFHSQCSIN